MKKQLLLIIMMLLPMMASADAIEIDGIYYNLITKGNIAEVTSNPNKYTGNISIPETVNYNGVTYSVTSISDYAFYWCSDLVSITIPNSVTSIGGSAFLCTGLDSVTIPNSVTLIGEKAFSGCKRLSSVTIPSSVSSIDNSVFENCSGLYSVTIPNSVTLIGEKAFSGCKSLTSVTIPNSVTSIGDAAFHSCFALTNVTLGEKVTNIGGYAFVNCKSLSSITIPKSVTLIGDYAFNGCTSLSFVNISDISAWCNIKFGEKFSDYIELSNPLYFAHHLYLNDEEVKDLIIPTNVTSISKYAFVGCSDLNSVTISNSVTSIGDYAFKNCSALAYITIGNSILDIGSFAFQSCPSLSDVTCYAESVPNTASDAFKDSYIEYATLNVPSASVNVYKDADPWKNFKSIVVIDMSKHKLIYMVDNVIYKYYKIKEGETITPEPAPMKDGYTFSGWSEIPKTMPDHDFTVTGTFSINSYKLTYMIDDKVYKETMYEYGATITPEPQPEGDYATFEWIDLPEKMPAHDVVVYASYTSGITEVQLITKHNIRIYSPNGKKLDKMQKGLNIVVLDDGTVKKVVIK